MQQHTQTGTTLMRSFGSGYKARVQNAIRHLQSGRGILLTDNEDRENEGDLIFPAATMQVADMALMIRACSGIVCLCITREKAAQLQLPPMVKENSSRFGTAFTVSIEAKAGVSTGVSASDRIQTIRTACEPGALPEHLARPGHVFPLVAADGGLLQRAGHTEGSIELMKLAGFAPEAVLCELTNDDGSMARLPEVVSFAQQHGFAVLSVRDIISYLTFANTNA